MWHDFSFLEGRKEGKKEKRNVGGEGRDGERDGDGVVRKKQESKILTRIHFHFLMTNRRRGRALFPSICVNLDLDPGLGSSQPFAAASSSPHLTSSSS
jgi:hypothetical protein